MSSAKLKKEYNKWYNKIDERKKKHGR